MIYFLAAIVILLIKPSVSADCIGYEYGGASNVHFSVGLLR